MKRIFLIAILSATFATIDNAQSVPELKRSKQEKAEFKNEEEQKIKDAIQQIGLTTEDSAQVEDAMKEAGKSSTELKKDPILTLDEKAIKKEEIDKLKNQKLKQIMGPDKYRQWNAIRKQQKESTLSTFDPNL
jgi:hypothetical protein